MAVRIQIRRDTTQNWYELNPILADGELGIEQYVYIHQLKHFVLPSL